MAEIISLSLDKQLKDELDRAERELGFGSRSELLRAGVKSILSENCDMKGLKGTITAVLIVMHGEKGEGAVSDIKHDFEDVITTQIHNSHKGACVEVFLMNGDAPRIAELARRMKTSRKISYSKLVVA